MVMQKLRHARVQTYSYVISALCLIFLGTLSMGNVAAAAPVPVFTKHTVATSGSGLYGLVVGSDDNIWYTIPQANVIGKFIVADGSTVEYSAGNPQSVTLGPDGNVWFTAGQPSGDKVGKITPPRVLSRSMT